MSGPTGSTTLSHPFVQTDPERASCVNKTDSNNAENETRGIDAAGSGFRSVIRHKLTDRSWCLLRRRARREPMGRNRCGRRMGHRRVRNIDFTVNLIYPLLSRCLVSRRTRKKKKPRPINKVLSSRLSPGQHLQTAVVLLHETIGSISQGVFRGFLTIPKPFVMEFNTHKRAEKQWDGVNVDDKQRANKINVLGNTRGSSCREWEDTIDITLMSLRVSLA